MFNHRRIGVKIGFKFAMLLLIVVCICGLAFWKICDVKGKTTLLIKEYIPEAFSARELESTLSKTLSEIKGSGIIENADWVENTRTSIQKIKKQIHDAKELANQSTTLVRLKNTMADMEVNILEYEKLSHQAEEVYTLISNNQKQVHQYMTEYMTLCHDYTALLENLWKNEIAGGRDAQAMEELHAQITLVHKLVLGIREIQLTFLDAQSAHDPAYRERIKQDFQVLHDKIGALSEITRLPSQMSLMDKIKEAASEYQKAIDLYGSNQDSLLGLNRRRMLVAHDLLKKSEECTHSGINQMSKISSEAQSALGAASITIAVGIILVIVFGVGITISITLGITGRMNKIIKELSFGAEQTSAAANQVSSTSQSLALGSSEQAASLQETTSSLEEITSMTKQNADNAQEAKNLAVAAKESADLGSGAMSQLSQAIEGIKNSSNETSKIVKTIDEIAFQTNLLALNAAVEAARAGESGKGFAVVADEVRNLAQRAGEAARNTAILIEGAVKNAEKGFKISSEAVQVLEKIATKAGKVNDLIGEIASASHEQAQGIEQLNTTVAQMDTVTQQNAANAEESASAAQELNAQAQQLHDMVEDLVTVVGGVDGILQKKSPSHHENKEGLFFTTTESKARAWEPSNTAAPAECLATPPDPEAFIPLDSDKELSSY